MNLFYYFKYFKFYINIKISKINDKYNIICFIYKFN